MKALITLKTIFVILAVASLMVACGGKTETKENEAKTAPVVSAVSNASPPTNNVAVSADGDRDDIKPPAANNANSATSKAADLDDVKKANRSANTKPPKKSGDTDDRGNKDSDGDDDDR